MSIILRLFPTSWRVRYGDEFLALIEDQPSGRRRWFDIARCLVAAHLDRSAPPSMDPAPLAGRAQAIATLVLAVVLAALGAVFLGTASQSAVRKAGDLIAPLLILAPLAAVGATGWALRRQGDWSMRSVLPTVMIDTFLLAVLGLIVVATLSPQLGFFDQAPWVELRPFVEVLTASTEAGRVQAVADMAGNGMLFVMLGFALALKRGSAGIGSVFPLSIGIAVMIEVAQAALGTGRTADSTDVVVRVVGAVVGYVIWRLSRAAIQPRRQDATP
jgi:glycopeptide antibiotics resistance protein